MVCVLAFWLFRRRCINLATVYDEDLSDYDITDDEREFGEWVFDASQWKEDADGFSRGA
jgi:hypothetical protein